MLRFTLLLSFMLLVTSDDVLFAVLGGTNCAENLNYGPQAISSDGSIDTLHPYFLSTNAVPAHTEWTEVITSDGTTELFRIQWTFTSSKTIADRVSSAVQTGEQVMFRVVEAGTGHEHSYSGIWRFSSTSHITSSTFTATETSPFFSADGGAFGASTGVIDGHVSPPSNFWGIGNFGGDDSTECSKVYRNGVASTEFGANPKVFMYYSTSTASSYDLPTFAPTKVPKVVGLHVQQQIDGITLAAYQTSQSDCADVYNLALQETLRVQGKGFMNNLVVTTVTPSAVAQVPGPLFLRRALAGESATNSILLDYTLTVQRSSSAASGSGVSYTQVSQALQDSVSTNKFTPLLQKYAVQQGVLPMRVTTSSIIVVQAVTVSDTSTDKKQQPGPPLGLIIGFSAGILVVICVTCYTCVYGCGNKTDIPYADASPGEPTFVYCDCTELPTNTDDTTDNNTGSSGGDDSSRTTPTSDLEGGESVYTHSSNTDNTDTNSNEIEMTALVTAHRVEPMVFIDSGAVPVAEVTAVRLIALY